MQRRQTVRDDRIPVRGAVSEKVQQARALRKARTDAERVLWNALRRKQLRVKFRRQHPIAGYIVDFYASALRLAIELDGGIHAERIDEDRTRDAALTAIGVTTLRLENAAVENDLEAVLGRIRVAISAIELSRGDRRE